MPIFLLIHNLIHNLTLTYCMYTLEHKHTHTRFKTVCIQAAALSPEMWDLQTEVNCTPDRTTIKPRPLYPV